LFGEKIGKQFFLYFFIRDKTSFRDIQGWFTADHSKNNLSTFYTSILRNIKVFNLIIIHFNPLLPTKKTEAQNSY